MPPEVKGAVVAEEVIDGDAAGATVTVVGVFEKLPPPPEFPDAVGVVKERSAEDPDKP
jgi:hypothetical protein